MHRAVTSRLLFVEDDKLLRSTFVRLFTAEPSWKIATACDAAGAIQLIESHPFDVIVMGYRMPGMTGDEVLAAAARMRPSARRIMLTSSIVEREAMHAHHVVEKPFDNSQLRAIVRRATEMRSDEFVEWAASLRPYN